ncbi:MAG TPA: hypothetical protein VMU29_14915 [Smithella sp.]|nr:hypothetical protein [Smithella sp.]
MEKAFSVLINGKEYDVWDIPGKVHTKDESESTHWIYDVDDFSVIGNRVAPPLDSPNWIPFSRHINRLQWDIRFTEKCSGKVKWDRVTYSNRINVEMRCNGKLVYEFDANGGAIGLSYAMAKAQTLMAEIPEHPFDFFNPQKEDGRKIWWFGLPATVKIGQTRPWEIKIVPDLTSMSEDDWWTSYCARDPYQFSADDDFQSEDCYQGFINWGDAFSDQHINWFRK